MMLKKLRIKSTKIKKKLFLYEYHSDLVYDCKLNLIKTYFYGILEWKPKNIYDPLKFLI